MLSDLPAKCLAEHCSSVDNERSEYATGMPRLAYEDKDPDRGIPVAYSDLSLSTLEQCSARHFAGDQNELLGSGSFYFILFSLNLFSLSLS